MRLEGKHQRITPACIHLTTERDDATDTGITVLQRIRGTLLQVDQCSVETDVGRQLAAIDQQLGAGADGRAQRLHQHFASSRRR